MCPELVEGHFIANVPLSLSKGADTDRLLLLPVSECGAVLAGVKARALRVALRRLRASLDPSSGRRKESNHREQEGEWVWEEFS